jgi:16S rRNA (adenine1518-N6/adenine1519-N6)-dimethyltransferase
MKAILATALSKDIKIRANDSLTNSSWQQTNNHQFAKISYTGPMKITFPSGRRPKYELGQNFIINQDLLTKEVDYGDINPNDTVLEIGAGFGNLTSELLKTGATVKALELDKQYLPYLSILQNKFPNLQVIWADATTTTLPDFNKVVANLPYRIALPIIFEILARRFEVAILVVHDSLARKLAARPGQVGYSRITVSVQRIAEVRMLETVSRTSFSPIPEVDSVMILLRRKSKPLVVEDEEYFSKLLDFMFFYRNDKVGKVISFLRLNSRNNIYEILPASLLRREVRMVGTREFVSIYRALSDQGIGVPILSNLQKRRTMKRTSSMIRKRF